jgi:peptidylprolyl isomerase
MNAADGSVYDSSWSSGKPKTFPLDSVIKGIGVGLTGAQAGDRVLICIASRDGYDPTGNGGSIKPGDSLVLVVDVVRVQNPLKQATGTKVSPPDTVPSLTLDKSGTPSKFTATSKTLKKPTQLGVYPLIEGNGPVVKSGQTIRVEYVGQLYPDGKVFDSSWTSGQPATFQIGVGQVIKAWDQGLVGKHVGSRVVLVVPAKLGYGKSGHPPAIPGNADLVFAVDILQAY